MKACMFKNLGKNSCERKIENQEGGRMGARSRTEEDLELL